MSNGSGPLAEANAGQPVLRLQGMLQEILKGRKLVRMTGYKRHAQIPLRRFLGKIDSAEEI